MVHGLQLRATANGLRLELRVMPRSPRTAIEGVRNGRLLVRYSGTEPLLRVMIEGRDQQEIQGWATQIVNTVKEHLG